MASIPCLGIIPVPRLNPVPKSPSRYSFIVSLPEDTATKLRAAIDNNAVPKPIGEVPMDADQEDFGRNFFSGSAGKAPGVSTGSLSFAATVASAMMMGVFVVWALQRGKSAAIGVATK